MSRRYASSGSNCANVRPTCCAIDAITIATMAKIAGSSIHIGRPLGWPPKKISWLPERSTSTGKMSTNATKNVSATPAQGNKSALDVARRKPMPMPRKLPSKTKLEKKDR
jgi:hypothetical protein